MRHRRRASAGRRQAKPCWTRVCGVLGWSVECVAPEQVGGALQEKLRVGTTRRWLPQCSKPDCGRRATPRGRQVGSVSELSRVTGPCGPAGLPAKNTRSQSRPTPDTCSTDARAPKSLQISSLHSPANVEVRRQIFKMARPGYWLPVRAEKGVAGCSRQGDNGTYNRRIMHDNYYGNLKVACRHSGLARSAPGGTFAVTRSTRPVASQPRT
jgi:hypothetical protein